MKKLTWITHTLAALMIILAALGAVCNAVYRAAVDETLYNEQSRAAVMEAMGFSTEEEVTAYIGLTPEEQKRFAVNTTIFMQDEEPGFDLPTIVRQEESRHMLDVRYLVLTARDVGKACLTLAAALAVIIAWTGARGRRRVMPAGVLAGAGIVAACVGLAVLLLNVLGFEAMFVGMHKLLFTNDLWIMDPQKHIFIRMMPQLLFERAAMNVAVQALKTFALTWLLLCAVYYIVGGMIRRHLTERETP